MKRVFKFAVQILKKNFAALLFFELSFRALTAVFLLRTGQWILDRLLEYQGYSYLTADNYERFMKHPLTALTILLLVLLTLLALLFESCAVLRGFEKGWKKERTTLPAMIREGCAGSIAVIRQFPLKWILYMAGAAPFLMLHLCLWEISRGKLAAVSLQKLSQVIPVPVLAGIFSAAFLLSMLWSFHLPQCLLRLESRKNFRGKRNRSEIAGALLVQILVFALVLVLFLAAIAVMTAGVRFGRGQGSQVSAVLIYGGWIRQASGIAAGGLGVTASLLYVYVLFAGSEKTERPVPRIFRKLPREGQSRPERKQGMAGLLTALILALESLLVLTAIGDSVPDKTLGGSGVAVTAHRGGARFAPENTLSAMETAVEALADYAEIDVQETKDGEIVLLHDTNLKRVTGLNANIWELSYQEVSQLDAGIKFHKKFRGEKIPTLSQVLEYCRGKIRLNIELKYNGHNGQIVPKVVKIIEEYGGQDTCVITSMNYGYLEQVKALNPQIATGYTLSMVYGNLSEMKAADFFSVKYTYLNAAFVRRAHALGKEVCAWTLNYQGDIQKMLDCGVDNIITDDPELVRRVILGELDLQPSYWDLMEYALR